MADDAFTRSLALVAERIGDPSERIYRRLFEQAPELEPLFVLDRSGAVRAEMLRLTFEALLDLHGDGRMAAGLIATERVTHGHNGITPERFAQFFQIVRDLVQETNGADWTDEMAAQWQRVIGRVHALLGLPEAAVGSA